MKNVIRWLAIIPGAVLAWYAAMIIAVTIHMLLARFCAAQDMVSGVCITDWYLIAGEVVVCFGTGLCALLVVLICAVIAPTHKIAVAWVAFAVGASIAIYMGVVSDSYGARTTALIVGLATATMVHRRLAKTL